MNAYTIEVDMCERKQQTKGERERGRRKKETMRLYVCVVHKTSRPYLFVSLQFLNEGALIEEGMQTFLGVVVA